MMNKNYKVLLVEDEVILSEIITENLKANNFDVSLQSTGDAALREFFVYEPDIVVLDIMLPDVNGFQVCKSIRQTNKKVPVIFLSAKSLPRDVIGGFEAGGNDYLKKPFSLEELIVRMKVLLSGDRMLEGEPGKEEKCEIGNYVFYPVKQLLQLGHEIRKLTSKEAALLMLLYANRNKQIDRKTILLKLWNDDFIYNSRSLDVFITRLRKYLSADPSVVIMNIRGVGYKLVF
jgi:DNA-binding response OmpR family regulator